MEVKIKRSKNIGMPNVEPLKVYPLGRITREGITITNLGVILLGKNPFDVDLLATGKCGLGAIAEFVDRGRYDIIQHGCDAKPVNPCRPLSGETIVTWI